MKDLTDILNVAKARSLEKNLPYSGQLTPNEAFEVLQNNPDAVLIDVRTKAELELVGRIPNATHIEWAFYPGMVLNAEFASQLQGRVNKNLTLIFMCRSGGRSNNAAMLAQQLGYKNVYNMLDGFEGDANSLKQRTQVSGWKFAGLPWTN
jgi:rhodanese-related sulfurtransferase